MKLGKQEAKHDDRTLLAAEFLTPTVQVPAAQTQAIKRFPDWGMLGNDQFGDCVFAGAAHETMNWLVEANGHPVFDEHHTLMDYSAVTGFDPNDPSSDQGTVVLDALNYRRRTGVQDARGTRHKLGAFAQVEPGDTLHLKQAVFLFDAVGIGIQFPSYAMDLFNAGRPWSYRSKHTIEGGHYVPVIGYDHAYVYCVTWARVQKMTWRFFHGFCDEAYALLSAEMLTAGKSPDGLDLPALQSALRSL